MKIDFVVDELDEWPKDRLLLIPSRLAYPMTEAEAVRWLREHSVLIVDLAVEGPPEKP